MMINPKHFWLLFQRQWFEQRKAWLVGSAAMVAILSVLFLMAWQWRTSFNGDTTHGIFLMVLFGGGGVYISALLKDFGNRQKGQWLLLLPAPAITKVAVALVYGIIGYLLVYFALFYGTKALICAILVHPGMSWGNFDLFKNGFYHFLFIFTAFQSIMLAGSVYFNKSQYLKILLLLIAALFIAFNGNSLLLQLMTRCSTINSNLPLDSFQFIYHDENVYVYAPDAVGNAVSVLLWLVVPLTFWVIAWCCLKEKEL
ncbi:MAG: hypothetical protein V4592_13815 [Bacteroidota bacterium]